MQTKMQKDEMTIEHVGMSVTLERLQHSTKALEFLMSLPVKAKIAFKLSKIVNIVNRELNETEAVRLALCSQYGKLNSETNNYDIRPETASEFGDKIQEWKTQLITFPQSPIKVEELGNAQVPADVFGILDWLFVGNPE